MHKLKAHRKCALILTMLLTSVSGEALAAEADENADKIPEIVVTANKRSENANKVGISITAVSAEGLLNAGVSDPSDLGKVVPGFYYTKSLYGTPVFSMRGVGFNNTALGLSPTVSVYVDEVPLPYSAMTSGVSLDIERIEALKGPQGVLFGNNSTGGAINYIAAAPTRDFHAGATLSYSRFDKVEGEAYLSGPLNENLRARVAVSAEDGGAWQISQTRPSDRLGDTRKISGRLLVDWDAIGSPFAEIECECMARPLRHAGTAGGCVSAAVFGNIGWAARPGVFAAGRNRCPYTPIRTGTRRGLGSERKISQRQPLYTDVAARTI